MEIKIQNNKLDFNLLFPFYFVLSDTLQIIDTGKSLNKIWPNLKGKNLSDAFAFKRPWSLKYTYESILEYSNQIFILNSTQNNNIFRGQIISLTSSKQILFIGTPWFVSAEEMQSNGLLLNDFALHDVMPDMFQFLKASNINTSDIQLLATEVKAQKDVLQSIIDFIPHQIFLKDLHERFVLVNKKVEEILGKSSVDIIGKTDEEILGEKVKIRINGDINHSTSNFYQEVQVTNNGNTIVNQISKIPFEINGELKGVLGVAIDISEQIEYENKIKISEDKYKALIENALDIIFQTDSNGNILFINSLAVKISEFSMDELLNMNCFNLIRNDYVKRAKDYYLSKAFLKDPIHSNFEFPLISKTGKEIWISQKVQPILQGKEVVSYQGVARDITEIKLLEIERLKTENELKKTTSRLKSLVENLNNGILVEDENKIIVSINEAFCKIFNIQKSPSELIGLSSDTIISNIKSLIIESVCFESTINSLIENKIPVVEQEFVMKSGNILERDFMPIFVKNEYKGQLWSYKDITSRKNEAKELLAAKELAEASSKAKDQFLSIMSHEIRTPMNAVIGLTQLLINKEPKNEQIEYLKSIKYSADNLLELINNILDFSKIESGNIIIENIDFDLHEVIERLENIYKYQTDEKGLRFMIHLNHKVNQYLKGDSLRLNQILINLIGNAIKFTDHGYVEVLIYNSKSNSKNIIFEVRDSGIGIEEENQSKIFERFTQANSDTTRKYGGTGLGLAITKLLVQLLGGTIAIQSKLGYGTSFFVELPFELGSKELVLNTNLNEQEMNDNLTGKKVLLVEDNHLNQVIAKEFLKQWGIEAVTAENGQEAINIINAGGRFNLILMDLQMPVMDGFTATQHIRNDYNGLFNDLPIIALSAATSSDIKLKAKQVGMNDFVSKPFESSVLFNVISKYINIVSLESQNKVNEPIINTPKDVVFSVKYYEDFSSGSKEFVKEMVLVYLDETPQILEALNDAVNKLDLIEIAASCHKLKTSFTMLGLNTNDVKKLEDLAVSNELNLNQITVLNSGIQLLGQRSFAELKDFLNYY